MTETTTAGPEARTGSGEPDGVIEDRSSWLDENWDPDLSVGEWWERSGLAGSAAPGLPGEPGDDRTVPFSELPKNA